MKRVDLIRHLERNGCEFGVFGARVLSRCQRRSGGCYTYLSYTEFCDDEYMGAAPQILVENPHSQWVRRTNAQHLDRIVHRRIVYNRSSQVSVPMPKKAWSSSAQTVLFPTGEPTGTIDLALSGAESVWRPASVSEKTHGDPQPRYEVVISGSFRRDIEGLKHTHEELQDLGYLVLSPTRVEPGREEDGFVFMKGEETETPESIELKHLEAIQKASFVWLHAPEGYVGVSAALEVGFAHAQGIPVFCRNEIPDLALRHFVNQVGSAAEVVSLIRSHKLPIPVPNVSAFQRYYRRVASQRGYERETAQNCLLLMVEEVGELAKAIRKREKLVRHGPSGRINEADELADVFLYVIHMANVLGFDLGSVVREKEELNLVKFLRAR
jgi:NTP pyrophosphatase (non-canonical NTP hydrolase)